MPVMPHSIIYAPETSRLIVNTVPYKFGPFNWSLAEYKRGAWRHCDFTYQIYHPTHFFYNTIEYQKYMIEGGAAQ